ncbi:hypothetical protein [Nitrosovibrio sp. Nv6]|uniref:hypothetical protein n=1 Tax=Nitrosovibrio sp. Nv6 TaxID=1855340 RepID=UPI000B83480A|nr:hypothetical protein [Nitrosovibrio sp. Nv6]
MLTHSNTPQPTRIISEPAEVDARLFEIDSALHQELLLEANQRGYEARLEATPAHAPTAAGTYHWHTFVAQLRVALRVQGWIIRDEQNCPLVISPDKSLAIGVMTGNSDTGKPYGHPTNQADKGAVLDKAVQRNVQYQLFENRLITKLRKKGDGGTQFWVLLYHVEVGTNGLKEIRTELSLPSDFQHRKIVDWSERIILRSLKGEPMVPMVAALPTTPFDVSVERKAGT